MDFGRLSSVSRVDFNIPPASARTRERNARVLATSVPGLARSRIVRVGAPIWSKKEWIGRLYPLGAQPKDFLHHYSRQLSAIELNITHYQIPTAETVREWRSQTPEGFSFCPKIPQEISHHRGLQGCSQLTQRFAQAIRGLGDRLGTTFLQLPPGFTARELPLLRDFLRELTLPVCVEFRHPSWFNHHALIDPALDVLEQARAGTVVTDVAGRRDVLHESLTARRVLVRFVGNRLDPSDYVRIDDWVERLRGWFEQGLGELYFFVHQLDSSVEPELIRYFIERFNAFCAPVSGQPLSVWTPQDQGTQLGLFSF